MARTAGKTSLYTSDTLLGQSRVQRSINKSKEGVFLARFSRPEALRVGSAIIEHHIIICWVVGLSGGFVCPPFKIRFRTLEVLTKKLVLSGSSEISAGIDTISRPIFSTFSIPNSEVSKFQHHAIDQFIPTACNCSRHATGLISRIFVQSIQLDVIFLWGSTVKCARSGASFPYTLPRSRPASTINKWRY